MKDSTTTADGSLPAPDQDELELWQRTNPPEIRPELRAEFMDIVHRSRDR